MDLGILFATLKLIGQLVWCRKAVFDWGKTEGCQVVSLMLIYVLIYTDMTEVMQGSYRQE